MGSNAVGSERISKVVGYLLAKGDFSESSPNLPQRVGIFAEANFANQDDLDLTPKEITSAKQAGDLYGYGSPIYVIMRILRPNTGGGIGGITTIVYPQAMPLGATAKVITITPTGVATANGTHIVTIAGRSGLDGGSYAINIETGDTTGDIVAKIEDAINNVLGCPFAATSDDYETVATSKWKGLTADGLNISIDTNGNDLGITYALVNTAAGAGSPTVTPGLELIQNNWVTEIINSYGVNASIMAEFEAFNGIPDPENPTGRFTGIIMKPFIALTGDVSDNSSATTDTKKTQVTIAICPAPLSAGLPMEAAANYCLLFARIVQDSPHLDISGKFLPDMPTPTDIGTMSDYENRDSYVKKGNSTVELSSGRYKVTDFVTTYHPDGELPPQFRYCRNLMIDFNVKFGYHLLEEIHVVDHAIAANNDVVEVAKVIKPKQWVAILFNYADDLARRSLIAEPSFMQGSLVVGLSQTNPDRLETSFKYKRTGFARILATTAEAGFNFGE